MNPNADHVEAAGRALRLAMLAGALLLIGLALVNPAVSVLAIPALVFLAAALLRRPAGAGTLHLQRIVGKPTIRSQGESAVTLTLTNHGDMLERVYVSDPSAGQLALVSGEAQALAALAPGATLELRYVLRAPRGAHPLLPVTLVGGETLGLFPWQIALEDGARLTALPEAERVREVAIRPLTTRGFAGPIIARRSGSGTDFFGVREYRMGDALRHVNWRALARHGDQPYTTEFSQEQIADVGLVLDVRAQQDFVVAGQSLLERAIQATAGMAEVLLAEGHRVALLQYGIGSYVPAGYGRLQRNRIFYSLAETGSTPLRAFYSLKWLPTQLFPPRSQMIFISPLMTDEYTMLFRLRAVGYTVAVVSPDPVAFEAAALDPRDPLTAPAIRLARIERQLQIRKLQAGGITVVNWDVRGDLNQSLQRVLRPALLAPPLVRGGR